jgi:hypothetical protein
MEVAMKPLVLLLIATALTSPLGAQDTTRSTTDSALTPASPLYRDPHRALILGSVIPGAGHIYAGEYWKGIGNYVGTVSVIGMGGIVFVLDNCGLAFFSDCKPRSHFANRILGGAVIGGGILAWISSARDAPRAAERANIKRRCRAVAVKPIIEAPVGSHGDWRVGVAVPW